MPDRSAKMKRRILGFQRRVWWPKWTPASSSSRMEATAMVAPSRFRLQCSGGARGAPAAKAGTRAHGVFRRVVGLDLRILAAEGEGSARGAPVVAAARESDVVA